MLVQANDCGAPAEGEDKQYEGCSADVACAAAVDCAFEDWGPWHPAECSAPCNGARKRARLYTSTKNGGRACSGPVSESVRCNPGPGEYPPASCNKSVVPSDYVQQKFASIGTIAQTNTDSMVFGFCAIGAAIISAVAIAGVVVRRVRQGPALITPLV